MKEQKKEESVKLLDDILMNQAYKKMKFKEKRNHEGHISKKNVNNNNKKNNNEEKKDEKSNKNEEEENTLIHFLKQYHNFIIYSKK